MITYAVHPAINRCGIYAPNNRKLFRPLPWLEYSSGRTLNLTG